MRYSALLRGINVGGNKKVEMKKLKSCFEEMGFQNVSTYINSGNVLFSSEDDDFSKIEGNLVKTFGFDIPVLVRSAENIVKLSENISSNWMNNDIQKTDVIFLWNKYDSMESIHLIKINPEVDRLIYIDGAIIWNISRDEYKKSAMNKFIGSIIYKNMTARNVNTIRKLAEIIKQTSL